MPCDAGRGRIGGALVALAALVAAPATPMACPQPMMSVEGRYLAALPEVRRFAVGSGRLELGLEGGGRLLLERGE